MPVIDVGRLVRPDVEHVKQMGSAVNRPYFPVVVWFGPAIGDELTESHSFVQHIGYPNNILIYYSSSVRVRKVFFCQLNLAFFISPSRRPIGRQNHQKKHTVLQSLHNDTQPC